MKNEVKPKARVEGSKEDHAFIVRHLLVCRPVDCLAYG